MEKNEELLLSIALESGLSGKTKTSTAKLSKALGISQQTASRKLRALEKAGLISLSAGPSGSTVMLSEKGVGLLRERFLALQSLFGARKRPVLKGKVKDGLGEGSYYVSRPPYLKQFNRLLGFRPFFGTLNLVVDQGELQAFLKGTNPLMVEGFKTEERSFGKIRAFKVIASGKQAALLLPERTTHPKNEVEIISALNLRKALNLKEGSKVTVKMA